MISRKHALKIAKVKAGRAHDIVEVDYKGKRVTQFGIRRGSAELPHSYAPRQLYISAAQAQNLAACPMSAEAYYKVLIEKGQIETN